MKRFIMTLAMMLLPAGMFGADMSGVKTVYVLPMFSGLDQYLAVRLTTASVLQVVADPQNADAVLTDHLGQSFEEQLNVMYGAKPKSEDDKNGSEFARVTSGARSRGAIFLVNRKTRDVLWSTYERPKGPAPADLNRAADRIADKLGKSIKGK
jgi:hypothetical protein